MSEVKRYTAWAAEVALPRGTMVVLAADYDTETQALRYALEQWQCNSRENKLIAEENSARADALAAELATERLRADVAVKDANDAERRAAELESLARIFQTWQGASRDQCDESGRRLWDRIDAALAGQPQQGERCQGENCGTTTGQHSRECIEEAARDQGWIPTEEDFNGCAKAEQPAAVDEPEWPKEQCPITGAISDVDPADLAEQPAAVDDLEAEFEDEWSTIAADLPSHQRSGYSALDMEEAEKFAALIAWQASRAALAPAAVVMPARMTTIPEGKTISYAAGHEDALDAVARLNRNTVSLELLERICADALRGEFATADRSAAIRELRAILGAKT